MVFKATGVMFLSQLLVTLVLFARNVIVARLISVEDFGIAATFSILFAVIEMVANLSEVKLVVQDKDGDTVEFTNTLHSVQVIRGILSAGLMLAVAVPYANFVKTPELLWAYLCLAVIPLARGFFHLDVYRMQRRMQFMPFAINQVLAPVLGLVIALLVWTVQADYQVMLWAIIGQQIVSTLLSHLWAERPYGLSWNMEYVRRTLRFGLPLLGNGLVLLIITNGERMIVANQLDLVILGWFSAAVMLATAPTRILISTTNSIFLPKLSPLPQDGQAFRNMSVLAIEISLYVGLIAAVAIALLGPPFLVLLFGAKYAPGLEVLVLLGAGQAVRIARGGPNVVAMAGGHTSAVFYAGILRALSLPVAYWALIQGYGLSMAVLIALAFECLALAYVLWMVRHRQHIPLLRLASALAAFGVILAMVVGDLYMNPPTQDLPGNFHAFQLVILLASGLMLLAMPETFRQGMSLLRRKTSQGSSRAG